MGQRLNIEIKKKNEDKILANCYYHWSAYTDASLDLGIELLNNIINYKEKKNDVSKAIKLLQTTGAGLIEEDYNSLKENEKKYYKIGNDRNLGYICISKKGMENTRDWEEGRMTLELDDTDYLGYNSTIAFDVFDMMTKSEIKEDYSDEIKNGELNFNKLPVLDFDLTQMKLDDMVNFKNAIPEIEKNCGFFKIKGDKNYIYQIIY